jgi:hypothetical protein
MMDISLDSDDFSEVSTPGRGLSLRASSMRYVNPFSGNAYFTMTNELTPTGITNLDAGINRMILTSSQFSFFSDVSDSNAAEQFFSIGISNSKTALTSTKPLNLVASDIYFNGTKLDNIISITSSDSSVDITKTNATFDLKVVGAGGNYVPITINTVEQTSNILNKGNLITLDVTDNEYDTKSTLEIDYNHILFDTASVDYPFKRGTDSYYYRQSWDSISSSIRHEIFNVKLSQTLIISSITVNSSNSPEMSFNGTISTRYLKLSNSNTHGAVSYFATTSNWDTWNDTMIVDASVIKWAIQNKSIPSIMTKTYITTTITNEGSYIKLSASNSQISSAMSSVEVNTDHVLMRSDSYELAVNSNKTFRTTFGEKTMTCSMLTFASGGAIYHCVSVSPSLLCRVVRSPIVLSPIVLSPILSLVVLSVC